MLAVEQDEHAAIAGPPDQSPESLAQPQPRDAVVEALVAAGKMGAPFAVQDVRPGPGHFLEHHQTQRAARHVDAVAHRVGAEQAAFLLGAEDIDQGRVVHRVDMLRESGIPAASSSGAIRACTALQPADRGEQAERAAAGRQEQRAIGGGQRRRSPAARR